MLETEAVIEIQREIINNLKNCKKSFRIRKTHLVDPVSVYERMFKEGTYISYMIEQTDILIETGIIGTYVTFVPHYVLGSYTLRRMFVEMEQEAADVASHIFRDTHSAYDKCLYAHDYLAGSVKYDHNSESNRLQNCYSHSAYGALVKKQSVCQGIADAFQLLLEIGGVKCFTIAGKANGEAGEGNHSWNIVYLPEYDQWSHVDVTWDLSDIPPISHDYFMLGNGKMKLDHQWDDSTYPAGTAIRRS